MILTDEMLQEAINDLNIKLEPFHEKQIQAATYDMRVGHEAVTTSSKEVRNLEEKGFIVFEPGDFGFVTTMEIISIGPQYAARFGLRAKFTRKGLTALAAALMRMRSPKTRMSCRSSSGVGLRVPGFSSETSSRASRFFSIVSARTFQSIPDVPVSPPPSRSASASTCSWARGRSARRSWG